jgi:hypothetical protein
MTAEEIRDLCCTDVQFDPCAKEGRVSDYNGAEKEDYNFDPDRDLEQARADNPDKQILSVRTIGINGPKPGKPCGKRYQKWTGKNNCCDGVEAITYDWDRSVEVLPDGYRGRVYVTGGMAPYYWEIRGQGMGFDFGGMYRNIITNTPWVDVYATEFACGWCPITVTDGCSVASGGIRSTTGNWYALDGGAYRPFTGHIGHGYLLGDGSSTAEFVRGRYKYQQLVSFLNAAYRYSESSCADSVDMCSVDPNDYHFSNFCECSGVQTYWCWDNAGVIGFDLIGGPYLPGDVTGETDCGYVMSPSLITPSPNPCAPSSLCEANLGYKLYDKNGYKAWEWRC